MKFIASWIKKKPNETPKYFQLIDVNQIKKTYSTRFMTRTKFPVKSLIIEF